MFIALLFIKVSVDINVRRVLSSSSLSPNDYADH